RETVPFLDATGAHAGALLGDVLHDPFQSGGLGTPANQRVVAGMIHKAHNGVLFIDAEYKGEIKRKDILIVKLPYMQLIEDIAKKFDEKDINRLMVVRNVIGLASALAILGLDFEPLEKTLRGMFESKKGKLAQINIECAKMSFEVVKKYQKEFKFKLGEPTRDYVGKRLLLSGAISIALAKIVSGCTFQSYYPITPATDESLYLEERYADGIIPFQTEDEIAAIMAAYGAALTGARSSTSTSGPGFSLMAEG
ncbi:MAG: 2-oxoacid:acceptor oxidoreductase family protein, partial [Planctomycetota bacterium]